MASKARRIVILTLAAIAASSCSSLRPIDAPLPVCAAIGGVIVGTTAGVITNEGTDKGSDVVLATLSGLLAGELIGGALCREREQPPAAAVSKTPAGTGEDQ